ncbi:MAG: tetratricopeptide repeat protein [Candidatus Helarchaeota archaeon]
MSDPYSKAVEAYKQGDAKKAIKYFKKSVELVDRIGRQKLKGEILQSLAFAYIMNGQSLDGIKTMKESIIIFDKLKLPIKVVEGLAYIGALNFKLKKNNLAIKYYLEAQRIIKEKKLHVQCRELEADICADLGSIYDIENKFHLALENFNRALKLYRKSENFRGEARTYLDLGIMYYHQENYDDAKSILDKAIRNLKKFNELESIADSHLTLGKVFQELKNWDSALKEYNKALSLYEIKNNPVGIAESMLGIGISYIYIKGKELDSKKYLNDTLKLFKKMKNKKLEGVCLAWLAKLKKKLGEPDAQKFKNLAIKKLSEIGKEDLFTKIK